jgi:hypothetical protein
MSCSVSTWFDTNPPSETPRALYRVPWSKIDWIDCTCVKSRTTRDECVSEWKWRRECIDRDEPVNKWKKVGRE